MNSILPWCEKYRPTILGNVIMSTINKEVFNNIINKNNIPNLLFYGPPGTGKTTTILNLIDKIYNNNKKLKSQVIHLNASDDRGIDIIRNTILNFINSNNLFSNNTKFVILDEADYMTKIAQQALKSLIQENNKNIKYCLICNYISKIDYSLQQEFIKIKFNKLPEKEINNLITNIINNENLVLNKTLLNNLINYFNNDIRCMINFLQSNIDKKINILDNSIFTKLYNINTDKNKNFNKFYDYICKIEKKCNVDKFYIIKQYLYFILTNNLENIDLNLINDYAFGIHNSDNIDILIKFIYFSLINN